jgi:hypothetical protein
MKLLKEALCLLLLMASSGAQAFEYVDEKVSYVNHKFLSFRVGLGTHTFVENDFVDGKPGFSAVLGLQHTVTDGIDLEFYYQFSTFLFDSPDPILTGQTIETRTGMHQEVLRAIFYYPRTMAQPFISAGLGGYHFTGLNSETVLDFGSYALQAPIGAGLRGYLKKNVLSFQFEYTYHWMWNDQQSDETLSILGIEDFQVDGYSLMASFTFHWF